MPVAHKQATAVQRRPPQRVARREADRIRREMIDEFGELDRQVRMFARTQARYDALKRTIKSWFDSAPADAEATLEGQTYVLVITPRERERRIRDIRALADAVGLDELLGIVARYVPLGPIEELIGKEKVAALVIDERTGSRRIKAVAKHPSATVVRRR